MDTRLQRALSDRGWRPLQLLKDDAVSCVWVLEAPTGSLVLKRSRFFSSFFGLVPRWLTAREVRILRLLEGVEGIPRVHERIDGATFVREYVDAVPLDQCREVPQEFFEELLGQLEQIHARGVACVDLSKRDNILVDARGAPVLMDFQASMSLRSGGLRGFLFKPLLRSLQRGDIHHVYKHHRRCFADVPIPPKPSGLAKDPLGVRLHRTLLRRPYLWLKRSLQGRSR